MFTSIKFSGGASEKVHIIEFNLEFKHLYVYSLSIISLALSRKYLRF